MVSRAPTFSTRFPSLIKGDHRDYVKAILFLGNSSSMRLIWDRCSILL